MFCRGSKRDHDLDRHPYKVYFRVRKLPYSGIKIRMFVYMIQDFRKILMGTTILRVSQGPNYLGTGYKLSLREKVDARFVAEAYERFQFIQSVHSFLPRFCDMKATYSARFRGSSF